MKKVLPIATLALLLAAAQPLAAHAAQSTELPGSPSSDNKAAQPAGPDDRKEAHKNKSDAKKKKDAASDEKSNAASTASATPLIGNDSDAATTSDVPAKTLKPVPTAATGTSAPAADSAKPTEAAAPILTDVYRIGTGDVLDIKLLNANTRESTLFTVLDGGLLDYPLAGDPVKVSGMTTDEINSLLTGKVKLYDEPKIVVSVRQYASHSVIVTGLVSEPGTKVLRREAVPLYVLLAEAAPRPEAARATIMRSGSQSITVDLSDSKATATLIRPGDVIMLSAAPPKSPQFYYIGGMIGAPGQKDFHAGMTLTQAILASGGVARFASDKVKVSRQGADGRLAVTEYNLKQIEKGKDPDPELQPGDRIEVLRSRW